MISNAVKQRPWGFPKVLRLSCCGCVALSACHLSMLTVGFLLWLVCSRVLPENTFMQCFPDSVHTCPRTFLDGDSTCGSFRFHHKVTYGVGYRGHCKSPSDGGRQTKNLKSGPLRARGLRDLLQAGV